MLRGVEALLLRHALALSQAFTPCLRPLFLLLQARLRLPKARVLLLEALVLFRQARLLPLKACGALLRERDKRLTLCRTNSVLRRGR